MYHYRLEFGSYYLYNGNEMIRMIKDGAGIGLCFTKGEMWTIQKHGDPEWVSQYCDTINESIKNFDTKLMDDFKHHFIEIFPKGPILEMFNHTLQCTGRIETFLNNEYAITIDKVQQ